MNSNDFCSVNHILNEVTSIVNDEDYRNGFSEGWYISRIQDAMQELAFDTFYQKVTLDLAFPSETFSMPIPKNCFNLRELYLHNDDCCSVSSTARVYWKRLLNNKGNGPGYSAAIKKVGETSGTDPFAGTWDARRINIAGWSGTVLVANIINGLVQFGPDCAGYSQVRFVFNGMGGLIGEEPVIPRFFERDVNNYVKMMYYEAMASRDPRMYTGLYNTAVARYDKSHFEAKMRIGKMNRFQKESMMEYISNAMHK